MTSEEKQRQRICRKTERAVTMIGRVCDLLGRVEADVPFESVDRATLMTAERCLANSLECLRTLIKSTEYGS